MARGIDFRLWKDTMTHKLIGAVAFSPDASLRSSVPQLSKVVVPPAVQMVMSEAAEEAVKVY